MSRGQRFMVWVVVVAACLTAPVWMLAWGESPFSRSMACLQSMIAVTAMLWLLRTTAADSIRLPRLASIVLILIGFVWLRLAAFAGDFERALEPQVWLLVLLFIGAHNAFDFAVNGAREFRAVNSSPRRARRDSGLMSSEFPRSYPVWTHALFLWHPYISLVFDRLGIADRDHKIVQIVVVIGVAVFLCALIRIPRAAGWRIHGFALLVWLGLGALAVMSAAVPSNVR